MDAPSLGQRRTSVDSVKVMGGRVVEGPSTAAGAVVGSVSEEPGELGEEQGGGRPRSQTQDSAANDILADLDALQREVDAARAQFAKGG